jgi:hypothetical protein
MKETWDCVHIDTDSYHMFNSFLCTFLNIFLASFPVKYNSTKNESDWITQGINMSCKHKRSMYAFSKNSSDQKQQHFMLNIGTLLVNDEKFRYQTNVANAFSYFFITVKN